MGSDKEKQDSQDMWRAIGVASGAGFTMLAMIVLGVYIGYKIDGYFGLFFPAGVLIGGVLGAIIGFLAIYEQIVRK